MTRMSLADYMKERPVTLGRTAQDIGPYITISREYGCHGFSLGLLLLDILNEQEPAGHAWQIYHKDILAALANETHLAGDMLEREMTARHSLIVDFFRAFSKERVPTGGEIRRRIATTIRVLAIRGHSIILGQGGAAATADIPNGLAVRLEAPLEWRVKQVAFREGVSEAKAREQILSVEQDRDYVRRLYEMESARKPAFDLVYDVSVFTLSQLAQHIAHMMKLRKLV